jgi:hypothetical protein
MAYRIVLRKSRYGSGDMWCLYSPKYHKYKEIAMGERAEFPKKEWAISYRNSLNR